MSLFLRREKRSDGARAVYHGTPQTNVHVCKHNRRGEREGPPYPRRSAQQKEEMIPMTHPEAAFVSFWRVNRIGCVWLCNSLGPGESFEMKTQMGKKMKRSRCARWLWKRIDKSIRVCMCGSFILIDRGSHHRINLIVRRVLRSRIVACICHFRNFPNFLSSVKWRIGFIISKLRNTEKSDRIRYVGSSENGRRRDIF